MKMGCVPRQLTVGSAIAHLHSRILRLPFATLNLKTTDSASPSPGPVEVMRFPICHHQGPTVALVRGPLSLSLILLDSPTCYSEEFTELVANLHITRPLQNRISSLSPPSLRSCDPSDDPPSTSGLG